MKNLFALLFFIPTLAGAHAFPLSYTPVEFSSTSTHPISVQVNFTQDILATAHGIDIYFPDGTKMPAGTSSFMGGNPRTLGREIDTLGNEGIYVVSWRGVSAEDGHFTKGAFSFFVGAATHTPEIYGGGTTRPSRNFTVTLHFLFSSLGIPTKSLWSVERLDSSRRIVLTDSGDDSDLLSIVAYKSNGEPVDTAPSVVLYHEDEHIGPLVVPAKSRGNGVYVIPWTLFSPNGQWQIALTWSVAGEYDINATLHIEYPHAILDARHERDASVRLAAYIAVCILGGILLCIWTYLHHRKK